MNKKVGGVRIVFRKPTVYREVIPTDTDATEALARQDAAALIAAAVTPYVEIRKVRVKLPSGIVGWRFFAIDAQWAEFFAHHRDQVIATIYAEKERAPCQKDLKGKKSLRKSRGKSQM